METTPLLTRPKKRSIWSRLAFSRFRRKELSSRVIYVGQLPEEEYPPNYVCNQKYNILTFLPLVLYEQFRFFLNLYFLVMALSQFIPSIRIGYLYTYWGPLGFVLAVTLFREAVDDFRRYRRDREVNRQRYERIILEQTIDGYGPFHTEQVPASELRVGDIVMLHKGQRVPADMILLRTNETMGTVFIRTDQLDGEIDWKLRIPLPSTQKLPTDAHLLDINAQIFIEKPEKDIHSFIGTCTRLDEEESDSLEIENTLWSGCVVASGQATGLIIYTGTETRSVMNNAAPRSKVGRLDLQVNDLTKVLFVATLFTSLLMIILKGFNGPWYGFLFRFVLLFSYIIPISLRVNLEMGKVFYSWTIQRDKKIEGTVVRSTTIPEELGRIQYLLADKTGTLTKNEMVFQKLHLGNALYDSNNFYEVEALLTQYVTNDEASLPSSPVTEGGAFTPTPKQVWNAVLALALCHNVTPVYDIDTREIDIDESQSDMASSVVSESCGGAVPQQQLCDYQASSPDEVALVKWTDMASSPDEVALVKWTDMMGISLYKRDLHSIALKLRAANELQQFSILQIFPFTSESKMMGIIVQDENTEKITYFVKGADVALSKLLDSPWLSTECRKLAEDGLRTMVVARRTMTKEEYLAFESEYKEARLSVTNRNERTTAAMARLQRGLELLCLTGVEDRLADDVPKTLSMLRTAGIKIWMLTGDKLETALCIARSLHLGGGTSWHVARECTSRRDAHRLLQDLVNSEATDLIIEGETLEICLHTYEQEFVEVLQRCSGVVVARCSPTQKARVARLLRERGHVVAAAGDGGNDVAMIQEADMGEPFMIVSPRDGHLKVLGEQKSQGAICMSMLEWHLVVVARCSPTQKARVARLLRERGQVVSAAGDGGNDVAMIQETDMGEPCDGHLSKSTRRAEVSRSYLHVDVRVYRVVVARCSHTQKARVARLLREREHVVAAAGDGGNDVAMIQEADMGVGIEGAEGRAASLAGDVSVRQFSFLARLLLVHGRRSMMRSAALCLFIVHRGLIVSTMQAVFSVVFYFSSLSLYPGFLMVGYGTIYTVLPVFSLVLDKDLPSTTVLSHPQLYKQLTKGRQLSYKTFYIWTGISIYQGGVIMYGALVLFEDQLIHIVEISYTALILTELIMVALTVITWHRLMLLAELISLMTYIATLLIFTTYFDADFIKHWDFWWKVTTITLVSCLPLYIVKFTHRKWRMRQYKNIRK